MLADSESRCGSFEHRRRSLRGVGLVAQAAALSAAVPRVWGRAAVAMVVALAVVCVMVPAAQAQDATIQAQDATIAFQGHNGSLWAWNVRDGGSDLQAGMAPRTSPSNNNWGEIVFQANTGSLWSTCCGDLHAGMLAGTSPAINDGGEIAFQANTGSLWTNHNGDLRAGMMPGTSPALGHEAGYVGDDPHLAFQANTGELWTTQHSPPVSFRWRRVPARASMTPVRLRSRGSTARS